MNTGRILLTLGIGAVAICLAGAVTDKPQTYVDRSNGVETSIPGTTIPKEGASPAQPVPSFLYNNGGNTVLQNEAGSIFTRPDGRKVLIGAGGQTIVTGDDSDEDSDESGLSGNFGGNVVINGRNGGGQNFFSSNGGAFLMNDGSDGSFQTYNNHQIRVVNGGLQLTTGGKVYNFAPKAAGVKTQEKIDINGQQATVDYNNGNISVELADGTVLAKTESGLFSGDRQSFVNRKQIQENAIREAGRIQEQAAALQRQLQEQIGGQMKKLQEELQQTLGNIRF